VGNGWHFEAKKATTINIDITGGFLKLVPFRQDLKRLWCYNSDDLSCFVGQKKKLLIKRSNNNYRSKEVHQMPNCVLLAIKNEMKKWYCTMHFLKCSTFNQYWAVLATCRLDKKSTANNRENILVWENNHNGHLNDLGLSVYIRHKYFLQWPILLPTLSLICSNTLSLCLSAILLSSHNLPLSIKPSHVQQSWSMN